MDPFVPQLIQNNQHGGEVHVFEYVGALSALDDLVVGYLVRVDDPGGFQQGEC